MPIIPSRGCQRGCHGGCQKNCLLMKPIVRSRLLVSYTPLLNPGIPFLLVLQHLVLLHVLVNTNGFTTGKPLRYIRHWCLNLWMVLFCYLHLSSTGPSRIAQSSNQSRKSSVFIQIRSRVFMPLGRRIHTGLAVGSVSCRIRDPSLPPDEAWFLHIGLYSKAGWRLRQLVVSFGVVGGDVSWCISRAIWSDMQQLCAGFKRPAAISDAKVRWCEDGIQESSS